MISPRIYIVDYGLGNLFNVVGAIKKVGYEPTIINSAKDILLSDFLVIPGVGAFKKGMDSIKSYGFMEEVLNHVQKGKPLLGICLGMQMLFDSSEENGFVKGFGLISGQVKKINNDSLNIKVPHIGWGMLSSTNGMLQSFVEQKNMYFLHSYHPVTDPKYCVATTNYQGINITAMVNKNNLWGCQFHPEKSGQEGLMILKEILSYY